MAEATAKSKSASWQIILGDLPPNSKVTLFKLLAVDNYWILYPTAVDPVKATLSTLGCSTKYYPTSPYPDKT